MQQVLKKTVYRITVERHIEITLQNDTPEAIRAVTKIENGITHHGWVDHPRNKQTQIVNEKLILLTQELDNIDFPLVVRAINFPEDFNTQKVPKQ